MLLPDAKPRLRVMRTDHCGLGYRRVNPPLRDCCGTAARSFSGNDTFATTLCGSAEAALLQFYCTVNVAVGAVTPKSVAVIFAVPAFWLVASPLALMLATFIFDDFHVTELVKFDVVPFAKFAIAVNCCVLPTAIVADTGRMV